MPHEFKHTQAPKPSLPATGGREPRSGLVEFTLGRLGLRAAESLGINNVMKAYLQCQVILVFQKSYI